MMWTYCAVLIYFKLLSISSMSWMADGKSCYIELVREEERKRDGKGWVRETDKKAG